MIRTGTADARSSSNTNDASFRDRLQSADGAVQSPKGRAAGIDRSTAGTIVFTNGAVIRLRNGQRVELARPEIVEEEGWIYYVDGDGDLARRPVPNWTPPAAVREKLKAKPLAMFRGIPLVAELPFTKLAVRGLTIYESTLLAPANAAAVWRAAQTRARAEGFTAVQVSERIRSDYFDARERIIKRDRKTALEPGCPGRARQARTRTAERSRQRAVRARRGPLRYRRSRTPAVQA